MYGLIIQGGSFAIITYFLVFVLPKMAAKLFQVYLDALATFDRRQSELCEVFKSEVAEVRRHADERAEKVAEALKDSTEKTAEALRVSTDNMARIMESRLTEVIPKLKGRS